MKFRLTGLFIIAGCLAASYHTNAMQGGPLAPPAASSHVKPFRLGKLEINGNVHTKLIVILRMIPISQGDIFNQSLWDLGLEQINRSRLFEPTQPNDVVMKFDEANGIVDVELHLKERDHQRIDLNGGGGTN